MDNLDDDTRDLETEEIKVAVLVDDELSESSIDQSNEKLPKEAQENLKIRDSQSEQKTVNYGISFSSRLSNSRLKRSSFQRRVLKR